MDYFKQTSIMKKLIKTFFALALVVSMASCGNSTAKKDSQETSMAAQPTTEAIKMQEATMSSDSAINYIKNNNWKLVSLNGTTNDAYSAEVESFTLQFLPENKLAGTGACNRFNGEYNIAPNNELKITMGGSTRMACPNLNLEQDYFTALSNVTNYNVAVDTLTLLNGSNQIAKFKAVSK